MKVKGNCKGEGPRGKGEGGFTLLELLIVMALIGLLTGMIVPKFSGTLLTLQTKSAVNKISAILRYARNQAVAKQQRHTVTFNLSAQSVTLTVSDSSAQTSQVQPEKVYKLPDKVSLYQGINIQGEVRTETFTLVFYPAGNCSGGEIILQGKPGQLHHIKIDFITGIPEVTD